MRRPTGGGHIKKVMDNMRSLSDAKRNTNSTCMIYTRFIKHKSNLHEEEAMRQFTESLGFTHGACWAQLMPYEKLEAYLAGEHQMLSEMDRETIDNLCIDPVDAVVLSERYDRGYCHLRSEQITLDADGNSVLCCSVFDQQSNCIGNFLDMDILQMQMKKMNHETCKTCMALGAHRLSIPDPALSERITRKALKFSADQN